MKPNDRINAVAAGVLFIVATAAGVFGLGMLGDSLGASDQLAKLAAHESQTLTGAFAILVMGAACSGIAIALYPVLRKHSEWLAIGAVIFRGIEGAMFLICAAILVAMLTLGQEFVKAGSPAASNYQSLGVMLKSGYDAVGNAGSVAFSTAAVMYYWIFYRTRLVPRWLSVWGLVAISMSIAANLLNFFRVLDATSAAYVPLHLPIFAQEMVLAVWLIWKGFAPVEAVPSRA